MDKLTVELRPLDMDDYVLEQTEEGYVLFLRESPILTKVVEVERDCNQVSFTVYDGDFRIEFDPVAGVHTIVDDVEGIVVADVTIG